MGIVTNFKLVTTYSSQLSETFQPNMSFQSVLHVVNMQLNFLAKFGIRVIHFDPKGYQFYPACPTFWSRTKIGLAITTIIIHVLTGCHTIFLRNDDRKIFVELFTTAFAPGLVISSSILCYPKTFVYLMNTMLHFEDKCFQKMGKFGKLIA